MPSCSCLIPHRSAGLRVLVRLWCWTHADQKWLQQRKGWDWCEPVCSALRSFESCFPFSRLSGSGNVHGMSGKMYSCEKSFVTLGWSRTSLPGDTTGTASVIVPGVPRGAARTAGQEMFSPLNIFIGSDIFLKWGVKPSIPVPQKWAVRSKVQICWHWVAPLQHRVSSGHKTWRWPHQGGFSLCSPLKMLFPARAPFPVSSSMKIWSFLTDISYSSIWLSLSEIRETWVLQSAFAETGLHCHHQRSGLIYRIRKCHFGKAHDKQKEEGKKGNSELFPLFSYHSKFWEILKNKLFFFLKSLVKLWQIVSVQR